MGKNRLAKKLSVFVIPEFSLCIILASIIFQSQPEVKRALMAIPSGDERFFNRLQRAIERTVKFELNEYQISKET